MIGTIVFCRLTQKGPCGMTVNNDIDDDSDTKHGDSHRHPEHPLRNFGRLPSRSPSDNPTLDLDLRLEPTTGGKCRCLAESTTARSHGRPKSFSAAVRVEEKGLGFPRPSSLTTLETTFRRCTPDNRKTPYDTRRQRPRRVRVCRAPRSLRGRVITPPTRDSQE